MKVKHALIVAAVVALAGATAAYAQTTFTVDATGSKKAGTKKKPKPFTGTFFYGATGPGGSRAPAPDSWAWTYEGVKYNGKHFPTCTAQEIDTVQSDSVCPEESLVAEAPVTAKLGPENDPNTSAECLGKTIRLYNGGKNTVTVIVVGPATQCAGVAYLPPFEASVSTKSTKIASAAAKGKKKKASTSTVTLPWPDNITHPLPGIAGGLDTMDTTLIQQKTRVKGTKVAYYESTGCKGEREFTFVTVDGEGEHVSTANAGKCKK